MACSCPFKQAPKWSCKNLPLNLQNPVPKDIEIARSTVGKPIEQLCQEIGIIKYEPYGRYKAKVTQIMPRHAPKSNPSTRGKYVVVTGITPTPMGEGKSTTALGLAQALQTHSGKNCFVCLRQPSQGPTFGMKGGAAGGGYSQVWPMDEFNLHLTGDIHAVTAANNLIAAAIDARILHENNQTDEDLYKRLVQKAGSSKDEAKFNELQKRRLAKLGIPIDSSPWDLTTEQRNRFARLNIDPESITLNRVIDTNDRFLRGITIGQSATEKYQTRVTKFTISVASELMAILALGTDFQDVCDRVSRMVIGFTKVTSEDGDEIPKPVTCDDLCVSGAVCALLKDAIYPNLLQTLEGSPVLVHCGPFANVAHGNSSIIADKLALHLVGPKGFVVTEAGFASDVGFEKFMDIKCRASGIMPDCAILVATVRALKWHGKELLSSSDSNASPSSEKSNPVSEQQALTSGLVNLVAHIENIRNNFGTPVIVALNKFAGDEIEELEHVKRVATEAGASDCRVADNWAQGGAGAKELAQSLVDLCESRDLAGPDNELTPKLLYPDNDNKGGQPLSIADKIRIIASRVYGAASVDIPEHVLKKLNILEANGFGHLPVCIAKTHLSISHDPKLKGAPKDYTFPIVSAEVSAGAGFVYALAGEISTMPGLTTRPAFFDICVDPATGQVDGLF